MAATANKVIEAMKEAFDIFAKMELPIEERKCTIEYDSVMALINGFEQLEAAASKWISVEERLPEDDGMSVLCTVKTYWGTCVCEGRYSEASNRVWPEDEDLVLDEVTHWMPLPEPPKEEQCRNLKLPLKSDVQ